MALDFPERGRILDTARSTQPFAGMFKVGLTSFASLGPKIVRELRDLRPVFVDLKLHDIPAQVAGAVRAVSRAGATLTTVHAAGGSEMMAAAVEAARDTNGLSVAAVTVLTSLDQAALDRLGMSGSPSEVVLRLAESAIESGADALVCSPLEVKVLRNRFGQRAVGGPLLVVPGVRPAASDPRDQRRTGTPQEALAGGADVIVIGRPITEAPDPAAAARGLMEEMAS